MHRNTCARPRRRACGRGRRSLSASRGRPWRRGVARGSCPRSVVRHGSSWAGRRTCRSRLLRARRTLACPKSSAAPPGPRRRHAPAGAPADAPSVRATRPSATRRPRSPRTIRYGTIADALQRRRARDGTCRAPATPTTRSPVPSAAPLPPPTRAPRRRRDPRRRSSCTESRQARCRSPGARLGVTGRLWLVDGGRDSALRARRPCARRRRAPRSRTTAAVPAEASRRAGTQMRLTGTVRALSARDAVLLAGDWTVQLPCRHRADGRKATSRAHGQLPDTHAPRHLRGPSSYWSLPCRSFTTTAGKSTTSSSRTASVPRSS